MRLPQNGLFTVYSGLEWNILYAWMIWGNPHFSKPPIETVRHVLPSPAFHPPAAPRSVATRENSRRSRCPRWGLDLGREIHSR